MAAGTLHAVLLAAACAVLLWASVVDARRRMIPNAAVVALAVLWAVGALTVWPAGIAAYVTQGLIGGVVTAGVAVLCAFMLSRARGAEALGAGDVKLLFAVGLFTGAYAGMAVLAAACLLACLYALIRAAAHAPVSDFPFAPFIACAAICAMVLF